MATMTSVIHPTMFLRLDLILSRNQTFVVVVKVSAIDIEKDKNYCPDDSDIGIVMQYIYHYCMRVHLSPHALSISSPLSCL